MSYRDKIIKRLFDFTLSFLLLLICILPILFLIVLASIDTGLFGVFTQTRIGYLGNKFKIFKIRSLDAKMNVSVFGKFLRESKLDELPQLLNVLVGEMSFVGPRPDIEGFSDKLEGDDSIILTIKPGITGPATLKYRREESLLSEISNPEEYVKEVIWPDKVEINKKYIIDYSFKKDLRYLFKTLFF